MTFRIIMPHIGNIHAHIFINYLVNIYSNIFKYDWIPLFPNIPNDSYSHTSPYPIFKIIKLGNVELFKIKFELIMLHHPHPNPIITFT